MARTAGAREVLTGLRPPASEGGRRALAPTAGRAARGASRRGAGRRRRRGRRTSPLVSMSGSDGAEPGPTRARTSPRITSTPAASRRCAVATRTKPESGDVDSQSCRAAKSAIVAAAERQLMPVKPPAGSWVRCQSPTPSSVASRLRWNGPVLVLAGHEREGLVQGVAEAGVDVPDPGRVLVRREIGDREHEVVRQHLDVGPGRPVHAADVTRDRVAERAGAAR